MSADSGSFRWFVGTPDARPAAVTDELMEPAQQRSTMRLSGRALQSDEHVDALRFKDEILAMVAHELRGPLTPLQFAADHIRRASADRPEVLRSVDMIDRQIAQITRLAEDLMDAMVDGSSLLGSPLSRTTSKDGKPPGVTLSCSSLCSVSWQSAISLNS